MDADFDASTKSKNEYDSNDEENGRVVELFGVWSKIDANDLSAWVGVGRCVSDRWEKNKKERTERTLNRKKTKRKRCACEWSVSMNFLLWRRTDKEEGRKKQKWRRKEKKKKKKKEKKRESDQWDVTGF